VVLGFQDGAGQACAGPGLGGIAEYPVGDEGFAGRPRPASLEVVWWRFLRRVSRPVEQAIGGRSGGARVLIGLKLRPLLGAAPDQRRSASLPPGCRASHNTRGWRVRGVRRGPAPGAGLGGRAALPCRCCFRARCARPGTSAAALVPGLRGMPSSVPAFFRQCGRSRWRASLFACSQFSCPLDYQSAARVRRLPFGVGRPPGPPRRAPRPRGGTSPIHRPLTGPKARFAGPVTSASPSAVVGDRREYPRGL